MRLPVLLMAAVLAAGCMKEAAEPSPGEMLTLTGTLIDTHCYAADHANMANDHMRSEGHVPDCGTLCARQGYPVGLLIGGIRDGDVWVLVTTPAVLADYMSRTVRVTGEVRSRGVLIPHRVEMNEGEEWTYIL